MAGWGRSRVSRGLGAVLAACALAVSWAAVPASAVQTSAVQTSAVPAGAGRDSTGPAAAAWRIQPTPNPTVPGGNPIEGVSCPAVTACTAVAGTVAFQWNGTAWTQQSTASLDATTAGLNGVSCPTTAFCMAVGSYGSGGTGLSLAEDWTGSSWTQQTVPVPEKSANAGLDSVSCVSASFCMAVGIEQIPGGPYYRLFTARWNGQAWRLKPVPQPARGVFRPRFNSVSCVSATFCEALGGDGNEFAEQWNGTSWTLQTGLGNAHAVSCVSASFCAAVGKGHGDIWNGTGWARQAMPAGEAMSAVSCLSTTFCVAAGYASYITADAAQIWNGTAWTAQSVASPAGETSAGFYGLSCASATFCEAGGGYQTNPQNSITLAAGWNGSSWALQSGVASQVTGVAGFNAVSCVSAGFCEAVGFQKTAGNVTVALAERWNGTRWTIQPTVSPPTARNGMRMDLNSVSCVSVTFCEAVGYSSRASGYAAEQWNGTRWTLQPTAGKAYHDVSCVSPDFCMAVLGASQIALWNGTAWSAQPVSLQVALISVSCVSAQWCEAIGGPLQGGDVDSAAVWNGATWTLQDPPTPSGTIGIDLVSVSCTSTQSCQAVGQYYDDSPNYGALTESWNGTAWVAHIPPAPADPRSYLTQVSCASPDFCAAIGEEDDVTDSTSGPFAEVWNGTKWSLRTTPNSPTGTTGLRSMSCRSTTACTAVGSALDGGDLSSITVAETGR